MSKTMRGFTATLIAVLFCGVTLAQAPMENINKNVHPKLAEAQRLIGEANKSIAEAQRANKNHLGGHAEKARRLLAQASQELAEAAAYANAQTHKR